MSNNEELVSTFQEAARIAQSVPEQFRDAAFQRALDALLAPPPVASRPNAPKMDNEPIGAIKGPEHESAEFTIDRLLREVDSSAHPEIHDAPSLRDQCLMVLRVIKSEYGTDGLTTVEVEKLLSSKFRVRVDERGIRRALAEAGRLVDRVPEGRGFRYRIMEAGEQHLDGLAAANGQDQSNARSVAASSRRRRRMTSAAPAAHSVNGATAAPASTEEVAKATRKRRDATAKGRGPAVHLRDLIAGGWFSSPRTVQGILAELARRGAVYKRTDLTRLMINLVRSRELTRDQVALEGGRNVWHYSAPAG